LYNYSPLFVTWEKESTPGDVRLRGCIGTLSPTTLANLREFAFKSALKDRRFDPIGAHELERLHCSVSLLLDYEDAEHYADWDIDTHGIIIEFHDANGQFYSATYLPDVAREQGWDHLEAVTSLVRKAGFRRSVTKALLESIKLTRYRSAKHKLSYQEYLEYKQAIAAKAG
jgi:AMME syndrome candidate gene 1 protein